MGFSATDEEKKIKLSVMEGGVKNNTVFSVTLRALSLSMTFCQILSSSFVLFHPSL